MRGDGSGVRWEGVCDGVREWWCEGCYGEVVMCAMVR